VPADPGLPEEVAADLTNARVLYADEADQPCRKELWQFDGLNASMTGNSLRIYGKQDWAAGANWSRPVSENEGMLFDLKFAAKSEFNVLLDYGQWDTPEYRRFGVYVPPTGESPFRPDIWRASQAVVGQDASWEGVSQAQPDTWYRVLLVAGAGGRFRAYAWPLDDPSSVAKYAMDMEPDWAGLEWHFNMGANHGDVTLRAVTHLAFDALK
jgi:hypothetical protein